MTQLNPFRVLAAGAVLAAASGVALAQASGDEFKRPLRSGHARSSQPSGESSRSVVMMSQDDGDNTVELRIEDGKCSAKLNGEEVPKDRIVREKDQIRILDKDGKTVSTFHLSMDGGNEVIVGGQPPVPPKAPKAPRGGRGSGGGNWTPLPPQPGAPALPANPPKVMLGIHMDAPSDEVLKEYSLQEGQAILVTEVIDGLAADKAGLKEDDVITEIDGKKPVTQDTLREVLKTKEPGDTVEFTVLRKGGDKTIRVTLDKYDPEKLGAEMPAMPGEGWNVWQGGDGRKLAEQAMREAMRNQQQFRLAVPGDGERGFVFGGRSPDMDKKLADLDKKMADLDQKLARVDEQMAKLQALIEKLAEQRSKK